MAYIIVDCIFSNSNCLLMGKKQLENYHYCQEYIFGVSYIALFVFKLQILKRESNKIIYLTAENGLLYTNLFETVSVLLIFALFLKICVSNVVKGYLNSTTILFSLFLILFS